MSRWSCRFDYLARDSMHLGIPISFNSSRVLKFSKVSNYGGLRRVMHQAGPILLFGASQTCCE